MSSIPGLGRSPGAGNGNPLQYSCLENSMDRGVWRVTVRGVVKSQTRLRTHTYIHIHVAEFESNKRGTHIHIHTKDSQDGTSLVVQWLVLCPSSARGTS